MNRSSFLKTLFILAASPKVLAVISRKPKVSTTSLFQDLNFVIPEYIPKLCEKYGDVSFYELMERLPNFEAIPIKITHFETAR